MLSRSKILSKSAFPILLLALVAAGLVIYAISGLDNLAAQTRRIVDLQAVRLEQALNVKVRANEAAVNARNMILETREKEMLAFKARYDTSVKAGLDATDKLIALDASPERREADKALKSVFEALVAIMDRSNALGLKNDNAAADRKSTRLNSSHSGESRMPSSA